MAGRPSDNLTHGRLCDIHVLLGNHGYEDEVDNGSEDYNHDGDDDYGNYDDEDYGSKGLPNFDNDDFDPGYHFW